MPTRIRDSRFLPLPGKSSCTNGTPGRHRCTASGRQRQAAGTEGDVIGAEKLFQGLRRCAPSTLWPESWSGMGYVNCSGVHVGSATVSGLPSVAAV